MRRLKRGKAVRGQRRKTSTRGNVPKVGRGRRSLAAGKEANIARLTRERDEALAQVAATSDVLKVISRFTFDLKPIFQAILANATRLCDAKFGTLGLYDGEA